MIYSRKMFLAFLIGAVCAMRQPRPFDKDVQTIKNALASRYHRDGMRITKFALQGIRDTIANVTYFLYRNPGAWTKPQEKLLGKVAEKTKSLMPNFWNSLEESIKYENGFQTAVEALEEQPTSSTELLEQKWSTSRISQTERENTIRVVQFNILAQGLSGLGAGFAGNYKVDATTEQISKSLKGDKDAKPLEDLLLPLKQRELMFSITEGTLEESMYTYTGENWDVKERKDKKNPNKPLKTLFTLKKGERVESFPFPERFKRIAGMLLKQNPDVITLQELDRYEEMEVILKRFGYKGAIQRKPFDSETTSPCATVMRGITDGVAIFWNTLRLEAVTGEKEPFSGRMDKAKKTMCAEGHELKKFVTDHDRSCSICNTECRKRTTMYECRPCDNSSICDSCFEGSGSKKAKQVYMGMKLKVKKTGKEFVVVTGHFKSGDKESEFPDKCTQAQAIAKIIHDYHQKGERVILSGDFNVNSEDRAFKLFYDGARAEVNETGKQKQFFALENVPKASTYLSSSYRLGDKTRRTTAKWRKGGEQPNKIVKKENKEKYMHTIDYIFYTKKRTENKKTVPHIVKKATLNVPLFEKVMRETHGLGIPCWKYPSDHFMIGADLVLI